MRTTARRLERGFVILIDYGHPADQLYSQSHGAGTLTTFHRHLVGAVGDDPHQPDGPAWLAHPGEQDITAHVDLTSVRAIAEAEGLDVLGMLDQSYFLLGLGALDDPDTGASNGTDALKQRLALKTLLVPGGLGSTHKVLLLGKQVGVPNRCGGARSAHGSREANPPEVRSQKAGVRRQETGDLARKLQVMHARRGRA